MMASTDQTWIKPILIAPAIAGVNGRSPQAAVPYACQPCAKRKVKCNKTTPSCSGCRKAELECFYQAPIPRIRKRRLSNDTDVLAKLARYERVLKENGLLDTPTLTSTGIIPTPDTISLHWNETETSKTESIMAGHGRSRYISSNVWRNLGDEELQRISTAEDEEHLVVGGGDEVYVSDPLTGAFIGSGPDVSLLQCHPSHENALFLWETHRENVEPLCKILHIPSTATMVDRVSQQPAMASRAEECLLFAIYHFAVYSMAEEECDRRLGQSRGSLLQHFHFLTRQALVSASFLKTTETSVLQALVLFLMACRYTYDSHTYWIFTGVAVRIAQRMGLHRDGEKMGLPPFDVQMRRRLFYQLLPLDGIASQMSGIGIFPLPVSWDTQQPLNINDNQIWPGQAETPKEQNGATEMIFCLSRSWVGKFLMKARKPSNNWRFQDYQEAEVAIKEAECEMEEKYIRYCDIVNPLHFLTIGLARAGITFMRLKIQLTKVKSNTATHEDRRQMLELAQKILDTDNAALSHPGLQRFGWHVKPFFLWGTWDSMIFLLTSLWRRPDLFSPTETDTAWGKVEQLYHNHDDLSKPYRTLHVAFGRLTLKTWDANPPRTTVPEPDFITGLRTAKARKATANHDTGAVLLPVTTTAAPTELTPTNEENASSSSMSDINLWLGADFELQAVDWLFWEQLIQADQQVQSVRQPE